MGLAKRVGQTPQLLTLRGECLLYTGSATAARSHLQKALREDPDNNRAQVLYKRLRKLEAAKEAANDLYKKGKYVDACEAYAEALEVDPSNKEYNANLHCNKVDCTKKCSWFHREGAQQRLHSGQANAELKTKQYAEAMADANAAIGLVPGYAKAFAVRAEVMGRGAAHLNT